MGDAGLEYLVDSGLLIEPLQERPHLAIEPRGGRGLEVNAFATRRAGNHLHRAGAIVAPVPNRDPGQTARSAWKQTPMPFEQALRGERHAVVLRCVERHVDDAVHASVGWLQGADVDAEPPRHGRAHLIAVERVPLDIVRLDDLFGQTFDDGLSAEPEPKGFHPADELALTMTRRRERLDQRALI